MSFQDRLKNLEAKLASLTASDQDDLAFGELPAAALETVQGGQGEDGGARNLEMNDLILAGGSRPRTFTDDTSEA
jgi:hypothetical protein